jgi:hypothetical protein
MVKVFVNQCSIADQMTVTAIWTNLGKRNPIWERDVRDLSESEDLN